LHGLLVVEDKLSMAHGLETRVPFLDNDLVDFSMSCPVSLKLNNLADVIHINENDPEHKQSKFFQKTRDGKQILRDVMKRHIPDKVTEAKKQGFSAPDASWFKGDSIEFVKRTLMNGYANIYEYMDRPIVEKLIKEHLDGTENRRLLIWSLLNVEQYLKEVGHD
jgi:asparagine synthase (glutamine-hydrolysing)